MRSRSKAKRRCIIKKNRNILQSLGIAEQYNKQRKKKIFNNDSLDLEKHKTFFFSRRNLLIMGYREVQTLQRGVVLKLREYLWRQFREEFSNKIFFERIFKIIIVRFLGAMDTESISERYSPVLKHCLLPQYADKMFFIFRELVLQFYYQDKPKKEAQNGFQNKKVGKVVKKSKAEVKQKQKAKLVQKTNMLDFFGQTNQEPTKPENTNGIFGFFKVKEKSNKKQIKKPNDKKDKDISIEKKPQIISNLTISEPKADTQKNHLPFSFKKYFYVDCLKSTIKAKKQKKHAIVINGPPGCGKRTFVKAFCNYYDYQIETIDFCAYDKLKEVITKYNKATHQNDIKLKLSNKNSLSHLIKKEKSNNDIAIESPSTSSNCPIGVSMEIIIEGSAKNKSKEKKGKNAKKKNAFKKKSKPNQGEGQKIDNGLILEKSQEDSLFNKNNSSQDLSKKKIFLCTNLDFLMQKDYYKNKSGFLRTFQDFLDFVKKSNYLFVFCISKNLNFLFDSVEHWISFIDMSSFDIKSELNIQVKMIIFLEKLFSDDMLKLKRFRSKQTSNEEFKYRRIFKNNFEKLADFIEKNDLILKKTFDDHINQIMIDTFLMKMGANIGKIFSNLRIYFSLFTKPEYKLKISCLETKSNRSLSVYDFFAKREKKARNIKLKDLEAKNHDFLLNSFICLNYQTSDTRELKKNTEEKEEVPFQKEYADKIRSDFGVSKSLFVERIGYKDSYSLKQQSLAHKILLNSDVMNKYLKENEGRDYLVGNPYVQEIFENKLFDECRSYKTNERFFESKIEDFIKKKYRISK